MASNHQEKRAGGIFSPEQEQDKEGVMRTTMRISLAVLLCAGALLFAAEAAKAADEKAGGAASEAKPDTPKPEEGKAESPEDGKGAKPDEEKAEKPDEGKAEKPEDGKAEKPEEGAGAASEIKGTTRLKDLASDGFVIRTTVFIPADAVTRQLGKVSPDAVVLTLQKSSSTAICYYTFKAYVADGLNSIPSCIVHR
jgi:hypothetical protein